MKLHATIGSFWALHGQSQAVLQGCVIVSGQLGHSRGQALRAPKGQPSHCPAVKTSHAIITWRVVTPRECAMTCQCTACKARPHNGLPCHADQRQVQRGRQRQRGLQGGGRHRLRARDRADARGRARPLPLHHQGAPGQGECDPLSRSSALHTQECCSCKIEKHAAC